MPKVYDPDVIEVAKKCQDPAKDLWGFGQTLNRSRRRQRLHAEHPLGLRRGRLGQGRQARARPRPSSSRTSTALQFAVDTIQKHKIQPPGVMGWTDVSNNEAYMAGKLVTTNNGASLYYAMVSQEAPLADKTQVILTPGGPAGSFVGSSCYNWGIFQKTKHAELAEDMIRWVEDEKRFEEYMKVSHRAGRARLQGARREPVLEDRSRTSRACCRTSCAACGRLSRPDHAGGHRGAGAVHAVRHGGSRGGRRALARGRAEGSARARRGDLQDPQPRPRRRPWRTHPPRSRREGELAEPARSPSGSEARAALGLTRVLGPDYRLGLPLRRCRSWCWCWRSSPIRSATRSTSA